MMGYYGWPMMGGWWGGGWGIGMMIVGTIIWIVIILGIIWLIRAMARGGYHHMMMDDKNSAIKILKERYAKGEIDKKEFEEKSRDIKNL